MRELYLIILLVTRETQLLASQTMRYVEAGRIKWRTSSIDIGCDHSHREPIIGRFRGGQS